MRTKDRQLLEQLNTEGTPRELGQLLELFGPALQQPATRAKLGDAYQVLKRLRSAGLLEPGQLGEVWSRARVKLTHAALVELGEAEPAPSPPASAAAAAALPPARGPATPKRPPAPPPRRRYKLTPELARPLGKRTATAQRRLNVVAEFQRLGHASGGVKASLVPMAAGDLAHLKERGLIVCKGRGKGGRWSVTVRGAALLEAAELQASDLEAAEQAPRPRSLGKVAAAAAAGGKPDPDLTKITAATAAASKGLAAIGHAAHPLARALADFNAAAEGARPVLEAMREELTTELERLDLLTARARVRLALIDGALSGGVDAKA
jgi:hypothetical protein